MTDLLEVGIEDSEALDVVLARVAAGAEERDAEPAPPFPTTALLELERAGILAWNAFPGPERPAAAEELGLVRSVARADGSVGRIFDGHLNAIERIAVQGPEALRERELRDAVSGGVWPEYGAGTQSPGRDLRPPS